jgi:hypothetical protein
MFSNENENARENMPKQEWENPNKTIGMFHFFPPSYLVGFFFSFPAENSFVIIIIGGGDVCQVSFSKETGIFFNEQKTNFQEYLIGSSERKKERK